MEKQEGRDAAAVRLGDPWYDALADGWGDLEGTGLPAERPTDPAAPAVPEGPPAPGHGHGAAGHGAPVHSAADIYGEVQRGPAFQEVRRRYRRFVVPATVAFFVWYFAYVVAATAAPEFMARPVAGAVNVAMVAGLGQFLSTFLLTWAYARHARLHRDRAALELRWETQEMTRGTDR